MTTKAHLMVSGTDKSYGCELAQEGKEVFFVITCKDAREAKKFYNDIADQMNEGFLNLNFETQRLS